MKKIILTLIVLLNFTVAKAQKQTVVLKTGERPKPVEGTYYKTPDNLINKVEGIWEYKNGNETFKFEVKRKKRHLIKIGLDIYVDGLKARYCYNKKGDCTLVDNEINIRGEDDNPKDIFNNYVTFRFYDIVFDKFGKVRFTILKDGTANWVLYNRGMGIKTPTSKPINLNFSVPIKMVLTKIK